MTDPEKKTVTREQLLRDLRAAGVAEGDVLVVHSSLKAVGWIEGGAKVMIEALQETLGPEGTLIMPTFTFSLASWNLPAFDAKRTFSRVGMLTQIFWQSKNTIRTRHPTHSVAAWGKLAEEITAGPIDYQPLGKTSPLDRARLAGAKILLIGVGQDRNSTIHIAESIADMPYLSVMFTDGAETEPAWYYPEDKARAVMINIREIPGSSEGFAALDEPLVRDGVAKPVYIGNAKSTIMNSEKLCEYVVGVLHENPLFLLQGSQPSEITLKRIAFMATAGRNQAPA